MDNKFSNDNLIIENFTRENLIMISISLDEYRSLIQENTRVNIFREQLLNRIDILNLENEQLRIELNSLKR